MAIRPQDPRWKTARSTLTKEQVAERLFKSANRLFDNRVELRKDSDILQEAYDDATGIVTLDMYGNKDVKETRDMIYSLDHQIGQAARQMEYLARLLKKG
jgi:hypothetical protein